MPIYILKLTIFIFGNLEKLFFINIENLIKIICCLMDTIDKHDKFINGFEHSCSLQQAEAEVKTTSQATILLILFKCTSHV